MVIKAKQHYHNFQSKEFPSLDKFINRGKVVIYGAGRLGIKFAHNLQKAHITVVSFIDNNTTLHGKNLNGIPTINMGSAVKKYLKYPVLIASVLYGNEIHELLKKNKFKYIYPTYYLNVQSNIFDAPSFNGVFKSMFIKQSQEGINKIFDLLADKESKRVFTNLIKFRLTGKSKYIFDSHSKYELFEERLVCPKNQNEVFVDCGAYDGDTIKMFGEANNWQFNHIYAFEPDEMNYKKIKKWIGDNSDKKKIDILQMGVYNKVDKLSFNNNGTVDSNINSHGVKSSTQATIKDFIKVTSLDHFFEDKKPPTLVKMDIEGSEVQALKGMKHIIQKFKPKLAISIYHQPSDLWRIMLLIKSYNDKYKFYIRHFTNEFADTMCFAV